MNALAFMDSGTRNATAEDLHKSEERFRSLTGLSTDMYWEQDDQHRVTSIAGTASDWVQKNGRGFIGKKPWELPYINMTDLKWAAHKELLDARLPFYDLELARLDENGKKITISVSGEPVFDRSGIFGGYRGVAKNITEARVSAERLYRLANFDAASGLCNRHFLQEEIKRRAELPANRFALVRIELARIKSVGELFGSEQAAGVIATCVQRMREAVSSDAVVSRLGTSDFAVLTGTDAQEALALGTRLCAALAKPVVSHGMEIEVGPALGIAAYPEHGKTADDLLASATAALVEARDRSMVPVRLLDTELINSLRSRRELAADLQRAMDAGELVLHYQPCVDARTGKVVSVEALVRWAHPVRGLIPPLEFIAAAEANGLIVSLGNWVLRTACRQLHRWHERGLGQFVVAVNLSARQLRQHNFIDSVRAALDESGLAAQYLEIEMTEGLLIEDSEHTRETLGRLKEMKVRIALDDFGTGYSSLSYLKRYPIDVIKIDKAFVKDITNDPDDNAIVRTIISMAKSLDMETVAEGIENEGQLAILRRYGCDRIQGWYFSKALAAPEFEAWYALPRPAMPATDPGLRTLLLLDDEPNILSSLKRLLRHDGYRILTANAASEAFELLALNKVGVVISDQRMPEMNGTEFLRRVKDLHPDTVRMVLSGYTELQSVTGAINEGAIYKFLTKPWDDDQLRASIGEAFKFLEIRMENERLHGEVVAANEALSRLNRDLESRIETRTRSLQRDLNHLYVAQEMLAILPLVMVGVDEDGMIAIANDRATHMFGRDGASLLGAGAVDILPQPVLDIIDRCDGNCLVPVRCNIDGADYGVWCRKMGAHSSSRGKIVILNREGP